MSMYTWALCLLALTSFAASFRVEKHFNHFLKGLPKENDGAIWALLVAGSNTWDNYRHQADVCHAYQVVKAHGIPDENIIVMMYDDLANNQDNPTPGKLINKPNGPNVYEGVVKDYTGDDVSSQNFLNVLTGNDAAMKGIGSGRVLKSGPNDHVFVNFVDHGGPGILGFPNDYLEVQPLIDAINSMHTNNQYEKFVFYVEACNSGSMFDGVLSDTINVYVTTAANPDESSYAYYWDNTYNTFLGDEYSINWMEDSDAEDIQKETLQSQFELVKQKTTDSHVMQYGQLDIAQMVVGEFQGRSNAINAKSVLTSRRQSNEAVPSLEVPKAILQHKLVSAKDDQTRKEIQQKLIVLEAGRQLLADTVKRIAHKLTNDDDLSQLLLSKKMRLTNLNCHKSATAHFHNKCFNLAKNTYATQYLQVLVNMCEGGYPATSITGAMDSVCIGFDITGIV